MKTDRNEQRLQQAIRRAAGVLYPDGAQSEAADALLRAFAVPSLALEASESDMRSYGLSEQFAFACSLAPHVSRYILNERSCSFPYAANLEQARKQLLPHFIGAHYECGYMLCLTKDARVLSCEQLRMGSIDEAPFYARIIIETALVSGGDCFILAHNHPGGTHAASIEDCISTLNILEAMARLNMTLIDHIIISDGEAISIRKTGSIPSGAWKELSPLPTAFKGWPG